MATARAVIIASLQEIGVLAVGESVSANDGQLALTYLQDMIDAWNADNLTLAVQEREEATLVAGTSELTIGPSGDIDTIRPIYLEGINYLVPGASPPVEVPLGQLDRDSYMTLSIKTLESQLPIQFFYQTSVTTALGTITFWPEVQANVDIAVYFPRGHGQPTTLDSILIGPPGWQEAFRYNLALRLIGPFGRKVADVPLLPSFAADAMARVKRLNTQPGMLGVDPAVAPTGGAAYNILSDTYTGASR